MVRDVKRDSWLVMGGLMFLVVIGMFIVFWIAIKAIVAWGFLAVVLLLLAFAWFWDRREKRQRAGLPEA
jgi:Flp pilus assembly protein TadB